MVKDAGIAVQVGRELLYGKWEIGWKADFTYPREGALAGGGSCIQKFA
jgi:hypothetical protein